MALIYCTKTTAWQNEDLVSLILDILQYPKLLENLRNRRLSTISWQLFDPSHVTTGTSHWTQTGARCVHYLMTKWSIVADSSSGQSYLTSRPLDDIKWKHFPRCEWNYWSPVGHPHKILVTRTLLFSLVFNLHKYLDKQSICWWKETLWRSYYVTLIWWRGADHSNIRT